MKVNQIICGSAKEVLQTMPADSINCCISSPPYWALRDYGVAGQLGLEKTFEEYIDKLCGTYDEVKRVLRPDGTCWVNLGDVYGGQGGSNWTSSNEDVQKWIGNKQSAGQDFKIDKGIKAKSLCLIPQRFAIEMVNRGWILRNIIIWAKPNPMPSSAKDRFTVDFEYVYFFVKQRTYFFEPIYEPVCESTLNRDKYTRILENDGPQAIRHDHETPSNPLGRNKRTVWTIPTQAYPDAHFATFPEKLVEPMILSGCPKEVCSSCGKGRRKVYEIPSYGDWHGRKGTIDELGKGQVGKPIPSDYFRNFKGYTDCGCGEKFRPGVVLDPFAGRARLARSLPSTDATGLESNSSRSISKWLNAA
jgi:site-specific DNA-methyltransferase (adenine-specific)